MRILLIKILLRLLSDNSCKLINDKIVQDWLMSLSDEKSGYKGYYTIRKKAILETLGVGVEQKEYWVNMGRLLELKNMNTLSSDIIKKYGKEKSKKNDAQNAKRKNDER